MTTDNFAYPWTIVPPDDASGPMPDRSGATLNSRPSRPGKARTALLAAALLTATAGTLFHFGLPTSASTAKTLRCEITFTENDSFVMNGVTKPIPTTPPLTRTVFWRIKGDQWAGLSMDGKDSATLVRENNAKYGNHLDVPKDVLWSPLKVTEQTYVLRDKASTDHTDFLSIDRTTGDVSGSGHDVVGDSTFEDRVTGHCAPVSGPAL